MWVVKCFHLLILFFLFLFFYLYFFQKKFKRKTSCYLQQYVFTILKLLLLLLKLLFLKLLFDYFCIMYCVVQIAVWHFFRSFWFIFTQFLYIYSYDTSICRSNLFHSPVTSTNVGIRPEKLLTFSFNPFATLV